MDVLKFLIIKFFILYLCHLCLGYMELKLESYNLCASNKIIKPITDFLHRGPEIKLDSGPNSAVIISQNWNSTYHPKIKTECKFRITSKIPRSGIYIAITKLQLRKDLATNSCIDYVEFSQHLPIFNININDRNEKKRTCENFGIDEKKTHLLFFDYDKEVYIKVFVDRKIDIVEPLRINIIATAHFECGSTEYGDFQCDLENNSSCIYNKFVNDRIKNCKQSCRDETDCNLNIDNKIDASNIVLSAITSLIFTMIGVGTCLWICWKYKDCMSLTASNSNQNEEQRQQNEISSLQTTQTNNTAGTQRPPSPKEDLPPSYESLFPDR